MFNRRWNLLIGEIGIGNAILMNLIYSQLSKSTLFLRLLNDGLYVKNELLWQRGHSYRVSVVLSLLKISDKPLFDPVELVPKVNNINISTSVPFSIV